MHYHNISPAVLPDRLRRDLIATSLECIYYVVYMYIYIYICIHMYIFMYLYMLYYCAEADTSPYCQAL